MTSYLIRHEACPKCKALGKDRNNDNLGIYSDGHMWCFSCDYYVPTNPIKRFREKESRDAPKGEPNTLPYDVSNEISERASTWCREYGISDNTLKRNYVLWSENQQRLIFPYYIEGELQAWQGRYFGNENKPKWFTQGDIDNILYTLGKPTQTICLVEDIVSAIKIASHIHSSPLFGSHISNNRFTRLSRYYKDVYIWLDPDKRKEAIKFASKGRLFGLDCKVIVSDRDPKEHTHEEIQGYLND